MIKVNKLVTKDTTYYVDDVLKLLGFKDFNLILEILDHETIVLSESFNDINKPNRNILTKCKIQFLGDIKVIKSRHQIINNYELF